MPEEEAFCVFVRLMQEYRLRELFKPSMAELGLCIYQFEYMLQVGAGRRGPAPSQPCRPTPTGAKLGHSASVSSTDNPRATKSRACSSSERGPVPVRLWGTGPKGAAGDRASASHGWWGLLRARGSRSRWGKRGQAGSGRVHPRPPPCLPPSVAEGGKVLSACLR